MNCLRYITTFVMFFTSFLSAPLVAEDVKLRSADGAISIGGTLRSFDGVYYRVETEMGILTVDGNGVICEGPGCPDLASYFDQIRISAPEMVISDVLVPMALEFARSSGMNVGIEKNSLGSTARFLNDIGETTGELIFQPNDFPGALEKLKAEEVDIFLGLRRPTELENKGVKDAGVADLSDRFRARVVALDAFAPFVNVFNSTQVLSTDDLSLVLGGKISNWSTLGWGDAPIAVHVLEELSQKFSELGWNIDASTVTEHKTDTALMQAVYDDPYALGIGRKSYAKGLNLVALAGQCGTYSGLDQFGIKSGDYPFVSPVLLFTPNRRLPDLGRQFASFMLTPSGQVSIDDDTFVGQSVDEISIDDQGQRLANALLALEGEGDLAELKSTLNTLMAGSRLSLGFRFDAGSLRLDPQSLSNLKLLAKLIEAGLYDGAEIEFIGFSDTSGNSNANAALSEERAKTVLSLLKKQLTQDPSAYSVGLDARGLGEALPLACNDSNFGRALNRRVETWVFR